MSAPSPSPTPSSATVASIETPAEQVPRKEEHDQSFLVEFGGPDDPLRPTNRTYLRKWVATLVLAASAACVTCASSMGASTYQGLEDDFGVSQEVATLSLSIFVLGLGSGPLLLAPLSEFVGRTLVYYVSFALFCIFTFPVAFAPDIAVHIIFRFLSGFAGSAFLSVAAGTIADMFENKQLALPMAIFSVSPFLGPVLGPAVAGFINQNTTWRWTYWVIIIWSFVQLCLLSIVPETHFATVLKRRAKRMRRDTGDDRWHTVGGPTKGLFETLKYSMTTPFKIIVLEPMAFSLNLWTSVLLGILYLFFNAFPIVFSDGHGFSQELAGLTFIGIGIGMVIGVCLQPIWAKLYIRDTLRSEHGKAPPESRLYPGMLGAILAPIGMFGFGFTTYPSIHWIVPIIISIFFGVAIQCVFAAVFTFLVDAFRPNAASAMAANSFMRSVFACIFPLFASQFYERLGPPIASAILGAILILCSPLPFVFYRYGSYLRRKSKFS